jgi:hypothetical protein
MCSSSFTRLDELGVLADAVLAALRGDRGTRILLDSVIWLLLVTSQCVDRMSWVCWHMLC